ncbi:MAG: hypothetical protein KAW12_20140 [Candidatus Aminicenantes bacterium]|nr:hypothetical protein [Candidatus Aminicenantes bacterium]
MLKKLNCDKSEEIKKGKTDILGPIPGCMWGCAPYCSDPHAGSGELSFAFGVMER